MDYKALVRPALNVYLAALALVVWTFASAAPVLLATAEMPTESIKLYAEPCSRGLVLAEIDPAKRALWRDGAAIAREGGETVPFCWIRIPESPMGPVIYVVAENGAHGPFPIPFFDKEVE